VPPPSGSRSAPELPHWLPRFGHSVLVARMRRMPGGDLL
jgi:hypothetical protein